MYNTQGFSSLLPPTAVDVGRGGFLDRARLAVRVLADRGAPGAAALSARGETASLAVRRLDAGGAASAGAHVWIKECKRTAKLTANARLQHEGKVKGYDTRHEMLYVCTYGLTD